MTNVIESLVGYAYLQSGNLDEAGPRLDRAAANTESIGFMAFLPISLVFLSEAHLRNGDLEKAAVAAERAAQMSFEYRQHAYHAWSLWMLGEISAHPAHLNTEAAEARYHESIRSATEFGMQPLIAHSHAGLAKLYRGSGQRAKSDAHFQTAATMYREMGMTYWLEQAEAKRRELP